MSESGSIHEKVCAIMDMGTLTCTKCAKFSAMSVGDSLRYFASGWPTCCGLTMLVSMPDDCNRRAAKLEKKGKMER